MPSSNDNSNPHQKSTMDDPDFQLFTSLRYDPLLLSLPINTAMWSVSDAHPSSPFYMASYHRDRMLHAAARVGWPTAATAVRDPAGFSHLLASLQQAIDPATHPSPLKVRVLLSRDGALTVESSPTPAVSRWNLFPARLPPPASAARLRVSPLTGGSLEVGASDSVHGDPPRGEPYVVLRDEVGTSPSLYTSCKTTRRDMYALARERVGIKDFAERKEVLIVSEKEGEIMEGSLTSVYFWRNGRWITPSVDCGGQVGTSRRWALEKGLCTEGIVKVEELIDKEEIWISSGVRGFQSGRIKLS